jgi:hypothetical protein
VGFLPLSLGMVFFDQMLLYPKGFLGLRFTSALAPKSDRAFSTQEQPAQRKPMEKNTRTGGEDAEIGADIEVMDRQDLTGAKKNEVALAFRSI